MKKMLRYIACEQYLKNEDDKFRNFNWKWLTQSNLQRIPTELNFNPKRRQKLQVFKTQNSLILPTPKKENNNKKKSFPAISPMNQFPKVPNKSVVTQWTTNALFVFNSLVRTFCWLLLLLLTDFKFQELNFFFCCCTNNGTNKTKKKKCSKWMQTQVFKNT